VEHTVDICKILKERGEVLDGILDKETLGFERIVDIYSILPVDRSSMTVTWCPA